MSAGMGTGQSTVASCDVTNCSFNKSQQCTAGSIQVSFVNGMAHCATYTTSGVASDSMAGSKATAGEAGA